MLRSCPGYRLEHIPQLTLRQFSMLVREGQALENIDLVRLANAVRVAHHGGKQDMTDFVSRLLPDEGPKEMLTSKRQLQDLGINSIG